MANGTDARSTRVKIGEGLQAFGAGLTGQGPQFQAQLAARREQQLARQDKDRERHAKDRRDAAITDAFGVKKLLELETPEGNEQAIQLLGNRIQGIGMLGGDPSDTLPIFQKAQSGDFKGALRDVNNALEVAEAQGFIKLRKEPGPRELIKENLEIQKLTLANQKARQELSELSGKFDLDVKDRRAIQKDVTSLIQEPIKIRNAASRLSRLGKTQTATDQLAAIFTFMKSLDPTSVVREGEQQQARSTGGITDQMIGFVDRIRGEGSLTENVFNQMIDTAKNLSNQAITDSRKEVFGFLDTFGDTIPERFRAKTLDRLPALFEMGVQQQGQPVQPAQQGQPPAQNLGLLTPEQLQQMLLQAP